MVRKDGCALLNKMPGQYRMCEKELRRTRDMPVLETDSDVTRQPIGPRYGCKGHPVTHEGAQRHTRLPYEVLGLTLPSSHQKIPEEKQHGSLPGSYGSNWNSLLDHVNSTLFI